MISTKTRLPVSSHHSALTLKHCMYHYIVRHQVKYNAMDEFCLYGCDKVVFTLCTLNFTSQVHLLEFKTVIVCRCY